MAILFQGIMFALIAFIVWVGISLIWNSITDQKRAAIDAQQTENVRAEQRTQQGYERENADLQEGDPAMRNSSIAQAIASAVQAVFAVVLGVVAFLQLWLLIEANNTARQSAQAAQSAAETARDALIKVQRAFVFINDFKTYNIPDGMVIQPIFRNSGTTPTRKMTYQINFQTFIGKIPDDFDFADLPHNQSRDEIYLMAPPQSSIAGQELGIARASLDSAFSGKSQLLVWGHADYCDVFSDELHTFNYAFILTVVKGQDGEYIPTLSFYKNRNGRNY